ncbi:MAG: cytochrome [Frankiales bacterium]|nr:cytochrome [Frankiales bacterium]
MLLVRRLAQLALGLQMLLVVSGTAVRVTGSGLGCPTWPRCSGGSLTNTAALGSHGYIEFGNRLLAVAMEGVGILLVLAVRKHAREHTRLAAVQALVVPIQAVIGGLLVLSGLNPYVLILHFLTSFPLVLAAAALLSRLPGREWTLRFENDPRNRSAVSIRGLAWGSVAATSVVLVLGTLVTGTGPHAGDARKVERLPFNPRDITQLHADGVWLLSGLVLALVVVGWRTTYRLWTLALLGLLAAQAGLGYWQYFHGVPAAAVALHVALATCVFTAASWLALSTGAQPARSEQPTLARAPGTATAR